MDPSIDTKKLRMFVTTVKAGSMRQASSLLFVTPSALSHGIRSLEESLGTQLFERVGPAVKTTTAGQKFFHEAADILSRLDSAIARFSGTRSHALSQLHIGTTDTGCRYHFPAIVREFRESFPEVALKLEVGDTDDLLDKMGSRKIDIVIAPIQRDYRELEQTELGHDELVYIVHPSHPWAVTGKIDRDTLSDQRLIMPSSQSHSYKLVDVSYRQMRIPLEPFIELNNEEAIKQLVSLSIGIGIVPKWIAQESIQRGELHAFQVGDTPLYRRWSVAHRADAKLRFAEFLFIGTTKAVSRNLLGGSIPRQGVTRRAPATVEA